MAGGKIIPLIAGTRAASAQDIYDTAAAILNTIEDEIEELRSRLDKLQDALDKLSEQNLGKP